MNNSEIEKCLQALWEYLAVRDEPKAADVMFVFGRDNFNIPEKALELYNQKGDIFLT